LIARLITNPKLIKMNAKYSIPPKNNAMIETDKFIASVLLKNSNMLASFLIKRYV
jgi:hypothetical protein